MVGKISVGKTLANDYQFFKFANIFPHHIIALYGISRLSVYSFGVIFLIPKKWNSLVWLHGFFIRKHMSLQQMV